MEVYKLHYPDKVEITTDEQFSMAIGFFDGLHKGHSKVIMEAQKKAVELGIQSAVMTFNPHPSHLFGDGKNKVGYITQEAEKLRILESMGIDAVFIVTFDWSLAALQPEKFIDVFIKKLGVKHVTAGFDFTFGSKGAGTMLDMELLADGEYGTTVVPKVADSEEKISSTRIRELLSAGDVEKTALLLGRQFRTVGIVVDGEKRGRLLGFPTANVLPDVSSVLPKNGVYAVRMFVDGVAYNGVCNVGVKPTFSNPEITRSIVEVHVLDFEGDLYGKEVMVDWISHIRDEKKFDSIDALVEQIGKDKSTAFETLTAI
ncbi:bifunctional riboflavin kinase/FAD synthetase [Sporosarcina siberiensis]|uniref:Riboflavin biosynthesis protein n=1 Tax=Sporosarcina siberiensis TaxID=1365606 RepID=A0ABW4SGL2_9BACL